MVNNMKPIIVTYSNESWIIDARFGQSFICSKLGSYNVGLISTEEIKLIARPIINRKTPAINLKST